MEKLRRMVAFRLDPADLALLDDLARKTDRDRSKTLRALLHRASATAGGDLRLDQEVHNEAR